MPSFGKRLEPHYLTGQMKAAHALVSSACDAVGFCRSASHHIEGPHSAAGVNQSRPGRKLTATLDCTLEDAHFMRRQMGWQADSVQ